MATIVQKQRKDGIAFLFQVKIVNPLTGIREPKSTTWKPPKGCTLKQAEREAVVKADAWEASIKARYNVYNPNGELTPDSTFKEVAEAWLEKIEKQQMYSHHASSKRYLESVYPHIGKIKVGKLTQGIIQSLFDWIDNREKLTREVRSIPTVVREVMKERNEGYATLIDNRGLNKCSLSFVLNGKTNVSYKFAKKFAAVLEADINKLFTITEKREPYSYDTNHHTKATVRTVLSFAKKRRIVQDNYATAEYIDYPNRVQSEIVCMDEDKVKDAYKAILAFPDIRKSTILLTAIFTGFRRGEICGLKWENLDLEHKLVTVNKSVSRVEGYGVIEKDPKTKKSKRTIEIPNILNQQLKKYKEWYLDLKEEMGDRWSNDGYVFINTDTGKRLSPDTILSWVNEITEGAGLGHWTVHSYRHTNITMKLLNNVPILEVAGEAGHSRTSTTTDRYGHYLATHKRQGPAVFDNLIQGTEK